MTDHAVTDHSITEAVRSSWGWFLALGIVFILGGLCAFLAPFIASLLVTGIVAAVLVIIGALPGLPGLEHQVAGPASSGSSSSAWSLLLGGIAIYFNPVAGAFALTLFVAAAFLAKGVFQIMLGFRIRPHDAWGWIVAAGIVAIAGRH